ncbi:MULTISPECIES: DUF58 domain-containing protein [Halobellus]|uniref:DUF58 domain-containing protein n=1 Tax=Halobellus TaxID=1073986 RepID=UPI002113AEDE|nr:MULTISPECIES: DUF58 domain-containing protein [Halobellus]MDQ2053626.1 DUF58 domain-containing protein [Halobellus sp. H-GB7]
MPIEPAFLDELARLEGALRRETDARQQGTQRSSNVGEGLTFSDYRRYTPGDDVRLVDWRVYARTDEYFIKQYEAERNLTVHVLLDTSASMDFGEGAANKFEFAARFGLAFAYFAATQHDSFRFSALGTGVDRLDRGRSTRGELLRLLDAVNAIEPDGRTDFTDALEAYGRTIHSRSLVVVVSDFLDDPEAIEDGIAALGHNDVFLVHVVAPEERDPDVAGDTVFEDPETGTTQRAYFAGSTAEAYRDRLSEHVDDVAARARTLRADHVVVDTGADFFESFAEVWRQQDRRERQRRRR